MILNILGNIRTEVFGVAQLLDCSFNLITVQTPTFAQLQFETTVSGIFSFQHWIVALISFSTQSSQVTFSPELYFGLAFTAI
jgi:hypothetical protein